MMELQENITKKAIPKNKYLLKIKRFFQFENRTFADYRNFLEKAKDNGFQFVPLRDFLNSEIPHEKIIGLRHDVDSELDHAIKIARIEHAAGVRSTYFVLHTAGYYYKDISQNNLNSRLINKLRYLQDTLGHEIGIHTDLMPIEIIYEKDPANYLKELIIHLRDNRINVTGVAPHGNLFHHIYRRRYAGAKDQLKKNDIYANPYLEFDAHEFNLDYEAYNLPHDNYLSDARFINDKRWNFSYINNDFFDKKGRTIILTHPIHWAPSKFYYYSTNLLLTVRYFFSYVIEYSKYKESTRIIK